VQYLKLTCTSWGAAHVAGVAALVRARHPDWSAGQVRARLEDTAHDLGAPGVDPVFGHGLVDAAAAVR
jgi:subtilisin family serine protease